jgi:hypothetical protein
VHPDPQHGWDSRATPESRPGWPCHQSIQPFCLSWTQGADGLCRCGVRSPQSVPGRAGRGASARRFYIPANTRRNAVRADILRSPLLEPDSGCGRCVWRRRTLAAVHLCRARIPLACVTAWEPSQGRGTGHRATQSAAHARTIYASPCDLPQRDLFSESHLLQIPCQKTVKLITFLYVIVLQ